MAIATVRSTYSLDLDTVQRLEQLAALWNTSKSGALRRAIQVASEQTRDTGSAKLKALRQLQQRLALDADSAAAWCSDVTEERRRASERRLARLPR